MSGPASFASSNSRPTRRRRSWGDSWRRALPVFEGADDPMAVSIGYCGLGQVEISHGQVDAGLDARVLDIRPRPAGRLRAVLDPRGSRLVPLRGHDVRSRSCSNGSTRSSHRPAGINSSVPTALGHSRGSVVSTNRARFSSVKARAAQAERGGGTVSRTSSPSVSPSSFLAGDAAAAAAFGVEGCRMHEELGETGFLAGAAGVLAQALYALAGSTKPPAGSIAPGALTSATGGRG